MTWSATDLDRRFSAGPARDEITALASTLDALLGRIAAAVRQEQRLAAELSHELRTPLARVQAEAELALRRTRSPGEYRSALESVLRNTAQLTRIVEALLAAARNEAGLAGGRADATQAARAVVAACASLAHERGVRLALEDDGFRPWPAIRTRWSGFSIRSSRTHVSMRRPKPASSWSATEPWCG